MLTVLKSEAEIINFWKQPRYLQGNGHFATDSQGQIQTSEGDPRRGTFHQMQVTMGNTTYSVNGVLCIRLTYINLFMLRRYISDINCNSY